MKIRRSIASYVSHFSYTESALSLSKETNLNFHHYEVCDNVDLETVLLEYESYYFVKFHKYPRITKKLSNEARAKQSHVKEESARLRKRTVFPTIPGRQNSIADHLVPQAQPPQMPWKPRLEENGLIKKERLLKPLGGYAGYTGEWRELALTISKEIFLQNPDVRWDDIIGLNSAKRLVKEAVVYPIKYPQLFTGILSPWKGLLLYGPPDFASPSFYSVQMYIACKTFTSKLFLPTGFSGTGKTLLAKAVATECNTTFFNISASTIVSKWRGDSEKLVRVRSVVLFELARFHAPSTIFLDELDSLMSQRGSLTGAGAGSGGGGSEHEGSRRMKTELLMQMDGLAKSDDLVFLLAASNIPWELDHAMLRRLEKRILVDLPNTPARRRMFESFLPPAISSDSPGGLQLSCHIDYELVAELTEGYSGSDIRLVCKEAAMRVVRKIFDILEGHTSGGKLVTVI
ncbi:katanin p60 ATPase-containing subunit A1 [Paragonimus westermani]|uniref:Katanin p60 ATPase-containing subunit A-like 2 n=1 Tax=Paragonimus westermani TaxID=34504 RepID=A0A5J4NEG0_9TREM|nr:katanin p60 ATPase-containing subunit A1 [Paragonimus westermani]